MRGRESGGEPSVSGDVMRRLALEAGARVPATLKNPLRPRMKYDLMVLSFISTSGAASNSYLA